LDANNPESALLFFVLLEEQQIERHFAVTRSKSSSVYP
jgi:hypothetical protein